MKIQIKGRLTRREFLRAFKVAGEPLVNEGVPIPPTWLSLPLTILGVSLAAISFWQGMKSVGRSALIVWLTLFMTGFSALAIEFWAGQALHRQWKRRTSLREPLEGTVTYEGIELWSPPGQWRLGWGDFSRYEWDDRLIVLFYHTGRWLPFPKRYFRNGADWNVFRTIVATKLDINRQASEQSGLAKARSVLLLAVLVAALITVVVVGIETARLLVLDFLSGSHDLWRRVGLIDTEVLLASVAGIVGAVLILAFAAIPPFLASLWPTCVRSRFVSTFENDKPVTRLRVLRRRVDQFSSLGFHLMGERVESLLWAPGSREIAFASRKAETYGSVTAKLDGTPGEITYLYTPFADGGIILTTNWTRTKPTESDHDSVRVIPSNDLEQLLTAHTSRVRAFKDRGRVPVVGYAVELESRNEAAYQYYASPAGRQMMRRTAALAGALGGLFLVVSAGVIIASLSLGGQSPW